MQSPNQPIIPSKSGDVLHWRKLYGAASSLALAQLATSENCPVIYLCSEAQHMPVVAKELAFFAGPDLPTSLTGNACRTIVFHRTPI